MKVAIVVIVYNLDHRVFLLQMEAIKKFCTDNYVIEVIDNSTNLELSEAIKYHASQQGVNYRKTDGSGLGASHSHAFSANISFKSLYDQYDQFFYLDHDCIPVKPFSVTEILKGFDVAGLMQGQGETKYLWAGCVMWTKAVPKNLINFNPIERLRCDTGGGFYKVIQKYKTRYFDEVGVANPEFKDDEDYYFYMTIHEGTFIHFINSSNWRGKENNQERINSLINIAKEKIELFNN